MHKIRKGQLGFSLDPYNFVPDYSQLFTDSTYAPKLRLPMLLQTSQDLNTLLEGVVLGSKSLQEIPRTLPSTVNEKNTNKSSFSDKFLNSTFGKNFGAWNAVLNAGNLIMTGIVGDLMFKGPKGNLTLAIDLGWDVASDIAMKLGPYGLIVGLGMKGLNIFNKGVNAALGSAALDNMTTTDAILNNPLTGWNVGLVNALGGKNADTITKDEEVQENIGSSYTGSFAKIDDALTKSGKRYGLFSGSALDKANLEISEAKRLQEIMTSISDYATDRFAIRNSMAAINGNRRAFAMQGGYNLAAIRVGKEGMIIAKRVVSKYKIQEKKKKYLSKNNIEEFKEGGSLANTSVIKEINIDSLPEEFKDGGVLGSSIIKEIDVDSLVEEFKEGGKTSAKSRTLEELIEYAKLLNPRFILRMSEPVRDVDLGNGLRGTHRLSWGTTDNPNEAVVYPKIFENESGELIYDPEHAFDNAKKGDALIMTPEEAEIFTKGYKLGWPEFFQKFAEGGKFNVIPEGALHARLHHMENDENITKKGIPVVSEKESGELELHAEIEKEEIILRLSLTKRLEELAKEDTDEAALEAGKILVEEILNNTVDNTELLNTIN